jgi:hypothetical protein
MGNKYNIRDTSLEELLYQETDSKFNLPIQMGESMYYKIAKTIKPLPEPKVRVKETKESKESTMTHNEQLLIPRDRLETVLRALLLDQTKLQMLNSWGVDNWQKYDDAMCGYDALTADDVLDTYINALIDTLVEDAGVI